MTRLLRLFILLYSVTQSLCNKSFIPIAVSQIIRDFYLKNSENFDFILIGAESRKLKDLVNDVVNVTSGVSPYKLIVMERNGKRIELRQSAIMFFDNVDSYNEFHSRATLMNNSPRKFDFLIYINDLRNPQEISESQEWPLMLSLEGLIQESSDGSINLWTYSKFHQPDCGQWRVELLNKFSQSKKKWLKKDFFVEKFVNLNSCELVVDTKISNQPYSKCDLNEKGKLDKCWGTGVLINEEIGRQLNYTSWHNPSTNREIYNATVINDHFIEITSLRLQQCIETKTIAIHPFTTREVFILISRDSLYTQFEKLFLPFEIEVWIWLIATMSIGVLTILVVKLAPLTFQKFVFGTHVNTPLLNFM